MTQSLSSIDLSIFASRVEAICDEMGAVLQRAAFSPNIKDRLDFSCAIFDHHGELFAQAAHIPVHVGSMAYAMRGIVEQLQWKRGDMIILNDPYLGGTHLPDVTVIAPLFIENAAANDQLIAFVANRAHHADIGSDTPGSMPISSHLDEEGITIPPSYLMRNNHVDLQFLDNIQQRTGDPEQTYGDFAAQISANRSGLSRLSQLIAEMTIDVFSSAVVELNNYAERLAQSALKSIPNGEYQFNDVMDDDGLGNSNLVINVTIQVDHPHITVDFDGTAQQVKGNINCPLSVTAAGVYYVFLCLMPPYTPKCAGCFRSIEIRAPQGSMLNAIRPAAVAAGNVETSTRVVDVVMGALANALPNTMSAASHGSMNNVALGAHADASTNNKAWSYYETIGGGMGAGPTSGGQHAVQTHMTNTRNTPVEVLESAYPMRIKSYSIREGSGGKGIHNGGNGIERQFEFLLPATVTLLTERRNSRPWGVHGGEAGMAGENTLNTKPLPAKTSFPVKQNDMLTIRTPGGGGWGKYQPSE